MVPTSERFVGPESGRLVTLFYHSATGDGATSGLTATETMRCGHYTPATAESRRLAPSHPLGNGPSRVNCDPN